MREGRTKLYFDEKTQCLDISPLVDNNGQGCRLLGEINWEGAARFAIYISRKYKNKHATFEQIKMEFDFHVIHK